MSVINVGKLLLKIQLLEFIKEFTLGRNPINVMDAGKLLSARQLLEYITTESIPERKPLHVMNLGSLKVTHTILGNSQSRSSCYIDWQIVSFISFSTMYITCVTFLVCPLGGARHGI